MLNASQLAAATAPPSPLLIIAGAGTGKTNTLAHRVAHLISAGMHPARILLLTFTRRAASEMLKRVHTILARAQAESAKSSSFILPPSSLSSRVWGGTFH